MMDGYYRDGDTVKRGSIPMFTFCMDYSTPEIMEAAKDAIVRLLNDDNNRQEFTPAKYPGLYTYCAKCGQVTKRT